LSSGDESYGVRTVSPTQNTVLGSTVSTVKLASPVPSPLPLLIKTPEALDATKDNFSPGNNFVVLFVPASFQATLSSNKFNNSTLRTLETLRITSPGLTVV